MSSRVSHRKLNENEVELTSPYRWGSGRPGEDPKLKKPIPKKAILLAVFLFLLGSVMLTLGSLLLTGVINSKHWDRGYSLLVVGSITFLPGFYYTRIAYYAYKGYRGYSFDEIPEYD